MSTKHTPGPWFVGETLSTRGACIVGDGDSVVCEFDGRHGETVEADARLIAAAPDLLEALRFVVERFEADKDGFVFSQRLALTKASAAIAKATGEQA